MYESDDDAAYYKEELGEEAPRGTTGRSQAGYASQSLIVC
jgi:hypothetical protein